MESEVLGPIFDANSNFIFCFKNSKSDDESLLLKLFFIFSISVCVVSCRCRSQFSVFTVMETVSFGGSIWYCTEII